jgi:hypothetical protein
VASRGGGGQELAGHALADAEHDVPVAPRRAGPSAQRTQRVRRQPDPDSGANDGTRDAIHRAMVSII